jgi:hypothetical protein
MKLVRTHPQSLALPSTKGKTMKQIFTLLAASLTFAMSAQIEAIDWPGAVYVDVLETQTEVALDIQNISGQELVVRLSSTVETLVNGADYRFCWGPTCYDWTIVDFTSPENDALMVVLADQESSSTFYTDYRPDGNEGTSTITYCWFDNNDPSIESCFTLDWQTTPVGVEEFSTQAEISEISPNPVIGTSSIAYNIQGSYGKANVQIYSLVGELVQDVAINNPMGLLMVNAADYNAGIYFVNIIVDGQIQSTKKMVVAK